MKHLLLSLVSISACFAAGPVGDWNGTLKAYADLRLTLHVQQEGGAYKATIDSIDQGAKGIPVSNATFDGKKLKLTLDVIKASYEGDLSDDGKTITGKWSQNDGSIPLTFYVAGTEPKEKQAPDQSSATVAPLLGVWTGVLDTGSNKLNVRFTLTKENNGQIKGAFDSIDQRANGMPMSGMSLAESKFHFDLRGVAGSYDGDVSDGKIKGTWKQEGAELPLEWAQSSSGTSKR